MSKRAIRRFHKQRMRDRMRRFVRDVWYDLGYHDKWICRMADNRCMCSRSCCGNPRKWFKEKTLAERKSDDSFVDQIDEADI